MLKNKELLCVRARLKPCARQLYPSRLHAITQANRYNLYLTFAPFCVHVNQDEPWYIMAYLLHERKTFYTAVTMYFSRQLEYKNC